MLIFTICSNNYLAQAIVLGNSVKKYNPDYTFKIFLCDIKSQAIDYNSINHEVIEIAEIEPNIAEMALKYNIIELNTAVKPTVFQHIFEKENQTKVVYLDPDICVFHSLALLEEELEHNSILLTPHILTPIPFDGKSPDDNLFLNYGIYNLGFLALKNDENSSKLLKWWKTHTYRNGFIKPEIGVFVDQLPLALAPILFSGTRILKHFGLNMAPWNLHERILDRVENGYLVNNENPLIFYHFSSFKVQENEICRGYNRYKLINRRDLQEIYQKYNDDLLIENILAYSQIISTYSSFYEDNREMEEKQRWQQMPTLKKVFVFVKKRMPSSLKNKFK